MRLMLLLDGPAPQVQLYYFWALRIQWAGLQLVLELRVTVYSEQVSLLSITIKYFENYNYLEDLLFDLIVEMQVTVNLYLFYFL